MSTRQLVLPISPVAEPSLDGFVTGRNAELIAKLREVSAGRSSETVIYLWGGRGSGRSHLLKATSQAAVQPERISLADDVDALDETGQIALFNEINRIRAGTDSTHGTLLAAGPAPPSQLALREDLKSRLAWGLVYEVRTPGDEEKAMYLRTEAVRRGFTIADDAVAYLLTHVRRDLPTLVALIAHLDEYSLSRQRPLTLPLVREALASLG